MVKSELIYNPYLMEFSVKFNGQPPRINSLIEKYQGKPLEDWINMLPHILYNEMNGYYFELDFSGTELDCEEIRSSFKKSKISEDEVKVFLKNELEARETKVESINSLLIWLEENQNRKFDYNDFRLKNRELFDEKYTYITIHNRDLSSEAEGFSVENVDVVTELDCTDLTHTPILFYLSPETILSFAKDLKYIINRTDVVQKQLFFYISNGLKKGKVRRTIIDLGIKDPNIVSDLFDDAIIKYFLLYPISDYISESIRAFRLEISKISEILENENVKSEITGKEIHMRLDTIEKSLSKLKDADDNIMQRDNIEIPVEFSAIKADFLNQISEWRNKKTKITKAEEAYAVAVDFNTDLHRFYGDFCSRIEEAVLQHAGIIKTRYTEWYSFANAGDAFDAKVNFSLTNDYPIIGEQTYELLKLKDDKLVEIKSNFIGQLFKSDSSINKETTLETTYYYQIWRGYMNSVSVPAIDTVIKNSFELLKNYSDELAEIYHKHLGELIIKKTMEKNSVSSQLSEEEKYLQNDNDWLSCFIDQVKAIERS